MIIQCTSCGSKYKYDERKLAGAASKKVKCPKCKGVINVLNQQVAAEAPADAEGLHRTIAAVPASSFEGKSSKSKSQSLDNTMPSPLEDSLKTAKVQRDLLGDATEAPTTGPAESSLKLPEYRKISLAVISGNNSGEIYQVDKPRMVIGRGDAEISIKDPEASRSHARIDVMGDRVILRDLNSTNGTYVNEQKVSSATLENHSEFRIGLTTFMLIITEVE